MKLITRYECEFETQLDNDFVNQMKTLANDGGTLTLSLEEDGEECHWNLIGHVSGPGYEEDEEGEVITWFLHWNCGQQFAVGLVQQLPCLFPGLTVVCGIPSDQRRALYELKQMEITLNAP